MNLEQDSFEKYNSSPVYDETTITHSLFAQNEGYSQNLLAIKAQTLRSYITSKRVLDIGCADGRHLSELAHLFSTGIGLDFSARFINSALTNHGHLENISFRVGDARQIDLPSGSVDVVYSFATLYYVDDISEVYSEIARLLAPGGVAILEVGNARSLATKISRRPENAMLAQHSARTIGEHKRALGAANLNIVSHRSFQLLPMWGNLDGIFALFRLPALERLMCQSINGLTIDERLSSLPTAREYAFRHLLVCKK